MKENLVSVAAVEFFNRTVATVSQSTVRLLIRIVGHTHPDNDVHCHTHSSTYTLDDDDESSAHSRGCVGVAAGDEGERAGDLGNVCSARRRDPHGPLSHQQGHERHDRLRHSVQQEQVRSRT